MDLGLVLDVDAGGFHMARGGGGVLHVAKLAVAQQGAQQGGFACVGVPNDGEVEWGHFQAAY